MDTLDIISCKEARDHMAEVINQVVYGQKRYALTRHGNEVAVIISYEEWLLIEKFLEQIEDAEDIRDAEKAMKRIKKGKKSSHEEVKRELGL